ncbi:AAA family ATPase [Xanthobacter variabilis]|uniref:AAA family ATPase n=1 Tax=Xanthobacter variabilis TaxID=3119932 RepID=UPI0037287B42
MKPPVDPVYVPLAEFEPEKVKRYWPYYLAASVITVLDGDPGIGKSFLAMHVAAQFSVGGSLPRQDKLKPSTVIYATMEDDPNFTIRPRIDAMGGNPENIFVQSRFSPFDEGGMKALSRAVEEVQPRLLG